MIDWLEHIDRELFLIINSCNSIFLDKLMWLISNDFFIYPFILAFLVFHYRKSGIKNVAILILGFGLSVACADLSTNIVKHNVKRYRPTHNLEIKEKVHVVNGYRGGQFGFFSSHAANSFAIATLVFLNAIYIRKQLRLLIFILPVIISFSRIYLGVHYPSDVIAGAMNGIICGLIVNKGLRIYFKTDEVSNR